MLFRVLVEFVEVVDGQKFACLECPKHVPLGPCPKNALAVSFVWFLPSKRKSSSKWVWWGLQLPSIALKCFNWCSVSDYSSSEDFILIFLTDYRSFLDDMGVDAPINGNARIDHHTTPAKSDTFLRERRFVFSTTFPLDENTLLSEQTAIPHTPEKRILCY